MKERVGELLALRTDANERFFASAAEPLARLCHLVAERFWNGGRLLAIGCSPQARSDARHVAVEFVHPVIVGKRALPARALTGEHGALREEVELAVEPDDIAIAFGSDAESADALEAARRRGCLTIAFERVGAEWELEPPTADPFVRQELTETAYHVLWELVHVFFEHRGLLAGRPGQPASVVGATSPTQPARDIGAASFLYPFLAGQADGAADDAADDLERVIDDVRGSIAMKAQEISALRAQTLGEGADGADRGGGGAARAPGQRRHGARARQRRLCDGRDGRRRRPVRRAVRLGGAPRDRFDRGPVDPHRDRQRRRRRRDLPAPGHRPRPRGRRAAGVLDQRRLRQRHPRARRGARARPGHRGARRLRRRRDRRRGDSPTT